MLSISHGALSRVLDSVYLALMTNLMIAVGCLPIVVVLVTVDPVRSWSVLVVVLPLVAPAFTAAAVVFAAYSREGDTTVVRTFVRAWRAHLRRSLGVGGAATAALVVLAVDLRALAGTPAGAVAVPVVFVLALLVVGTAVLALVAVAERPDVPVVRLLRASLYLGVRRWYLTVGSLLVLVLLAAVTASRPAIGLGLATAPLLYVVWANSRFTLRPILPAADATVATASAPAAVPAGRRR